MLEGFVSSRLQGYLDAYFVEFNSNNLSISTFGGNIKLQNLTIKESVLKDAGLPFSVVHGHIGKVNIQVSWGSVLKGEPFIVEVEDIFILIAPVNNHQFTEEEESARKVGRILQYEASERQLLQTFTGEGALMGGGSSPNAQAEMIALVAKLTEKIRVTVKNVHVRVEDVHSNPRVPMHFGLTMKSFTFVTTSDVWDMSDLKTESNYTHKYMKLDTFSVYWDCQIEGAGGQGLAGMPPSDIRRIMRAMIDAATEIPSASSTSLSSQKSARGTHPPTKVSLKPREAAPPIRQFLVLPFSAKAKIAVKTKGESDPTSPIIVVDTHMAAFYLRLDGYQYHGVLGVLDSMARQAVVYQYRRARRPETAVSGAAAEWWGYAYRAVVMDNKRNRVRWEDIKAYSSLRREYISLYVVLLQERGDTGAPTNSVFEKQQLGRLRELESGLEIPDLILYRKLALRTYASKVVEQKTVAKQAASNQGGWFSGWWGGSVKTTDTIKDSEDEEELRNKLRKAIEIDGDSDVAAVTDYDDHYVATRVRMSAGTLNVVVLTQADAQPLISSSADGMSTCMQMRPNVGGVDLTYSLQTFNVRDTVCEKDANIFPELMCVQEDAAEDNEVSDEPILSMSISTVPEKSDADISITMRTRKLQAVYNPYTVASILNILKPPPDLQLDEYAAIGEETLNHLARQSQGYLVYYSTNRTTVDVDITLQAPLLIIPEIPQGHAYVSTTTNTTQAHLSMIAIDLGGMTVTSKLADAMIPVKGEGEHTTTKQLNLTEAQLYDKYTLELFNVQVLLLPFDKDYSVLLHQALRKEAMLHSGTPMSMASSPKSTNRSSTGTARGLAIGMPQLSSGVASMIGKVTESVYRPKNTQLTDADHVHLLKPNRMRMVVQTCVQPSSLQYTTCKVAGELSDIDLHVSNTKLAQLMKIMTSVTSAGQTDVLLSETIATESVDSDTESFYSAISNMADINSSYFGPSTRTRRGLGWLDADLSADVVSAESANKAKRDESTDGIKMTPEEERILIASKYLELSFVMNDVIVRIDEGVNPDDKLDQSNCCEVRTSQSNERKRLLAAGESGTRSGVFASRNQDSMGKRGMGRIRSLSKDPSRATSFLRTKRSLLLSRLRNFEVRVTGKKFGTSLRVTVREMAVRNLLAGKDVHESLHYLVQSDGGVDKSKNRQEAEAMKDVSWRHVKGPREDGSGQLISIDMEYTDPAHPEYEWGADPNLGLVADLKMAGVAVNVHRESLQPLMQALLKLSDSLAVQEVPAKSSLAPNMGMGDASSVRSKSTVRGSNATKRTGLKVDNAIKRVSTGNSLVAPSVGLRSNRQKSVDNNAITQPTKKGQKLSQQLVAAGSSDNPKSTKGTATTATPVMYMKASATFQQFKLTLVTRQIVLCEIASSGLGAHVRTSADGTFATMTVDDLLVQDLSQERGLLQKIPENVPVGSTNEYKRVVALRESDKALFDLSVTIPNADSTASSDTDADKLRADISVKLRMTGVNVIFMNRFVTDISAYGLDFAAAMAKYTEELQQAKTNPHEQSVELKHSSSGGPRPSVSTVPMRDKAQASMQTLTKRNTVSAIKLRRPSTLVDENRLGVQQQGRSKSINNHNAAPGDRRRSSAKLKRRNSSANSDKALRNSLTTTISKFDMSNRRLSTTRPIESVKATDDTAQDNGPPLKLQLDVQIIAPTIVVPRGTNDETVVVADLGVFSATNQISTDAQGLLVDTMSVDFSGMTIWSDEIVTEAKATDISAEEDTAETLLSSTDIAVTVVRALETLANQKCSRNRSELQDDGQEDVRMDPSVNVSVAMNTVDMQLSDRQYLLLLQILSNNMAEEGVMARVRSAAAAVPVQSQRKDSEVTSGHAAALSQTAEDADGMVHPFTFAFKMDIKAVTLGLFLFNTRPKSPSPHVNETGTNSGTISSISSTDFRAKKSKMRPKNTKSGSLAKKLSQKITRQQSLGSIAKPTRNEFSRMWIRQVSVDLRGDHLITGGARIGQIDIDDVRSADNEFDSEFDFTSVVRVKPASDQDSKGSAHVVSVSLRYDTLTLDQFLEVRVIGLQVFFFPDYVVDMLHFVTPPAADVVTDTPALLENQDGNESLEDSDGDDTDGEHVESLLIGHAHDPKTDVSSDLGKAVVPAAAGTLKVALTIKQSEMVLLEDRSSEDTRAVLSQANLEIKGSIGGSLTNFDVEFYDARVQTCVLRRREFTLMDMIKPFSASVTYSATGAPDGQEEQSSTKAFIEMDDIVVDATYEELISLANMASQAAGGANQNAENLDKCGDDPEYSKVLPRKSYRKTPNAVTWYTSERDLDSISMATGSIGSRNESADFLGEQFLNVYEHLNIRPFSIVFTLWHVVNEVQQMPLLRTQVHLDAHACNWSSGVPIATANSRVECDFFNQIKGTSWETVVQPMTTTLSVRPYSITNGGMCVMVDTTERIEMTVSSSLTHALLKWSEAIATPLPVRVKDITYRWLRTTDVPCKMYNDLGINVTYICHNETHELKAGDDRFLNDVLREHPDSNPDMKSESKSNFNPDLGTKSGLGTNTMSKKISMDDAIDLIVEGFAPIADVPVTRVGIWQYTLVPLDELERTTADSDERTDSASRVHLRVAVDVSVEDQFRRIELRSTVQVLNDTTLALDVGCEVLDGSSKRTVKMATVSAGDVYNVPLYPSYYSTVRVRPTGYAYDWGVEGLSWLRSNNHANGRARKKEVRYKSSKHQTCFVAGDTEDVEDGAGGSSSDNGQLTRSFFRLATYVGPPTLPAIAPVAAPYPRQTIKLSAPVKVTNWLPFSIRLTPRSRPLKKNKNSQNQLIPSRDELRAAPDSPTTAAAECDTDDEIIEQFGTIAEPGETVSLYEVDTYSPLKLSVYDVNGKYTIKQARIPAIPSHMRQALTDGPGGGASDRIDTEIIRLKATDANGAVINFVLQCTLDHGVRNMRIYCPYWVVNRTGLPLLFEDSSVKSVVKPQPVTVPSESSLPALFSYVSHTKEPFQTGINEHTARMRVIIDQEHPMQQGADGAEDAGEKDLFIDTGVRHSEWSQDFSLDMPGTNGAVSLLPTGDYMRGKVRYDLTVQISMVNSISRMVTVKPRFVMCNLTHQALQIATTVGTNFGALVGIPDDEHSLTIAPHEEAPWFCSEAAGSLIQVRMCGQTTWTAPFDMSQPDDVVLRLLHLPQNIDESDTETAERLHRLRGAGAVSALLRVKILAVAGVLNVVLSVVQGAAPMVIENRCRNVHSDVVIRQTDCTTSYTLRPGETLPYTFDSPTLPRSLNWSLAWQDVTEQQVAMDGQYYQALPLPNGGSVHAMLIPDAACQIVLITDEQAVADTVMRNVFGMKVADAHNGSSDLEMGRSDKFVMEVALSMRGFGFSLLDLKPSEVAYVALSDFNMSYNQTTFHQTVEMSVGDFQIDYQGIFTQYPTIVSRSSNGSPPKPNASANQTSDGNAQTNQRPIWEATVVKFNNPKRPELLQFKYIGVLLQPLDIATDTTFLTAGSDWFFSLFPEEKKADTDTATMVIPSSNNQLDDYDQQALKTAVDAGVPLYVNLLELHPISVHLSFTMGLDEADHDTELSVGLKGLLGAVGSVVGTLSDIERSPVQLDALLIDNLRADSTVLLNTVVQHFTSQAMRQMYAILGSANFLGNPVRLFNTMGSGVKSFFYEPIKGASRSPLEFGVGLAKGSSALVSHTVSGVTGSLSTVGFTIGKGLANASFDKKFQRDRQILLAGKPRSLKKAFKKGGIAMVKGVYGGVSGVVLQPLSGAESGGVQGLCYGCGVGVVGLFAKPLSGLVDMGSNLVAAVALTFDPNLYGGPQAMRVRVPRFTPVDQTVTEYNPYASDGAWYLKRYRRGKYRSLHYLYHIVATNSTVTMGRASTAANRESFFQVAIILTLERVFVFIRTNRSKKHHLKTNIRIENLREVRYTPETLEVMLVVSAARFDSDDEVTILRISNVHFEDWARLEMHLQNTPYERWSQQNTSVTKLKQQHVAAKLRNAASDVATMSSVVAQMKHHDAGSTSDTASQTTLPTNTLTSASSTGSGTKGKDKA